MKLSDLHAAYKAAKPFPHVVLDGFFAPELLDAVLREWPSQQEMYNKSAETSIKSSLSNYDRLGPMTQIVMDRLNSPWFIRDLEALTGWQGLLADPWLEGGGIHHIGAGGFLGVHADFNWHEKLQAVRRINLLLYLNKNADQFKNGGLTLYDEKKRPVRTVEPKFNRAVIFDTSDDSWHGHPEPLECPVGDARKSLALYYYQRAAKPSYVHSTVYVEANDD